jgi:ATP-dependent Lhr-like helicase
LVWFDRRSSHLVTFPAAIDGSWAEALATLVKDGRQRSIEVRKVNGDPIDRNGAEASALLAAGFADGYRGLTLRGV